MLKLEVGKANFDHETTVHANFIERVVRYIMFLSKISFKHKSLSLVFHAGMKAASTDEENTLKKYIRLT